MSSTGQPDAVASVRLRPGMYIGSADEGGIEHLIFELVANSVDLFLAGKAKSAAVTLHENGGIEVRDDGPGLPYEDPVSGSKSKPETFLTELHSSPTADGHLPHIHLNTGGMGLVIVSALSKTLEVISTKDGARWGQTFERGRASAPPRSVPSEIKGTTWLFVPDPEIFGSHRARRSIVRARLMDVAHLFSGLKVSLGDECFHAPAGLLDYAHLLDWEQSISHQRPIHVVAESDGVRVEAVAIGSAPRATWRSWCNGTRTVDHGTHRDGFRDALKRLNYRPSIAMIHVVMTNPHFAGPARRQLDAPHIRSIVRDCVLSEYSSVR